MNVRIEFAKFYAIVLRNLTCLCSKSKGIDKLKVSTQNNPLLTTQHQNSSW